jgi:hypothetical protein
MPLRSPVKREAGGPLVLAAALALSGCASVTPPPRFGAVSPADPAAPEAPGPLPTPALMGTADPAPEASPPAAAAPGHEGHAGHGPGPQSAPVEAAYFCPMHPEVGSATPATCPKCGMKLVPKEGGRP